MLPGYRIRIVVFKEFWERKISNADCQWLFRWGVFYKNQRARGFLINYLSLYKLFRVNSYFHGIEDFVKSGQYHGHFLCKSIWRYIQYPGLNKIAHEIWQWYEYRNTEIVYSYMLLISHRRKMSKLIKNHELRISIPSGNSRIMHSMRL